MQRILNDGNTQFDLVPGATLTAKVIGGGYAILSEVAAEPSLFTGASTSGSGIASAGPFALPVTVNVEARGSVSVEVLSPTVAAITAGGGIATLTRERVAMVGSSLTDVCFVNSGAYGVSRRLSRSWIDWANYKLGAKAVDVVATYAVGGQTMAQIKEQIRAAVATDVDWVIGDLGVVNSISGAATTAAMQALAVECIDLIANAGKRGLLLSATPVAAGHGLSALYVHRQMAAVNKTMADHGRLRGVLIADASGVLVDPASSIGNAQASLLQADLIHYAQTGSRVIGSLVADVLSPHLQAFPLLPTSQADSYSATDNPYQLCTNPLMIGSVAANGGFTGNMPTGRSIGTANGTFTASSALAARSDGYGQDWVITFTAASAIGARAFITIEPDMTAVVAAGQAFEAACSIEITGASNLKGHKLNLVSSVTNGFSSLHEVSAEAAAIAEYSQADIVGGVMLVPKLVLPAGSTSFRLILEIEAASMAFAAVVKIGRVTIPRLS